MRSSRGRVVHVGSLEELDARLDVGAHTLGGWRVHGLDLSGHGGRLLGRRLAGATFLGCSFAPGDAARVAAAGALVLPTLPGVPVSPYRSGLYTAEELYDAPDYAQTLDARIYAWSLCVPDHEDLVAAALHDQAVDEALARWVEGRRVVGVMGGHAVARGEARYADAARLGHALARSGAVATGGGPGAMEAVNLGARWGPAEAGSLHEVLDRLAAVPSYRPGVDDWLRVAREVVTDAPAGPSLGIPTWHYGHEPANVFATAIAKYLRNAQREAVLLEVCNGGIAFLPGAAGTVQEVFQDACENYYADETSIAPMVLVGEEFWTRTLPAWPLLASLASTRAMKDTVHLVQTVDEAAEVLG
jgi:predicted Rossmann-fold nucleotide-binding protein